MFNQLVTNRDKSSESPLSHPGASPDSESARQPPLPGTPYKPYSEKPAVPELPYKPYAEKPVDESPYEPYKGIQSRRQERIMQLLCVEDLLAPWEFNEQGRNQKLEMPRVAAEAHRFETRRKRL